MSKKSNETTTIKVNGKTLAIKPETSETEKMDFELDYSRTDTHVDGVRYAHIDDKGYVLQVRVTVDGNRSWWTVKDAVLAGVLPEKFDSFKGGFVEYDAKIARVELMESLGIDVPNGVAYAYACALEDRKAAIIKKEEKEDAIVEAGKDAYLKNASDKASKRFDNIVVKVNARKGK